VKLTTNQVAVLRHLATRGARSTLEISRACGLSKGSGAVLAALRRRALIEGNWLGTRITPEGRAALRGAP